MPVQTSGLGSSLRHRREELCLAVAALPPPSSLQDEEDGTAAKEALRLLQKKLDPFFAGINDNAVVETIEFEAAQDERRSVTPLAVAADKGDVACLEYLAQKIKESCSSNNNNSSNSTATYIQDMIGSPTEQTPIRDGGNTAVHHAAVAGCAAAWSIFHDMMLLLQNNTNSNNNSNNNNNNNNTNSIYLDLGRLTNAHGDTPLQMAASAGHVNVLSTWHQLLSTTKETKRAVHEILVTQNQAGDTCVSLASCHGHVDIIQYLILWMEDNCQLDHNMIIITRDDAAKCQAAVDRTDAGIRHLQQQQQQQQQNTTISPAALAKHGRVQECLKLLQESLERQSKAATQQLLELELDDDTPGEKKPTKQSKTRKKKKYKKKQEQPQKQYQLDPSTQDVAHPQIYEDDGGNASNRLDSTNNVDNTTSNEEPLELMRLNDGRVAVRVAGTTDQASSKNDASMKLPKSAQLPAPSADVLFRERFRLLLQPTGPSPTLTQAVATLTSSTTAGTTSSSSTTDTDIDAVMDALCLDVSMLLLTPHGMALNLSPSQLEAIQQILEKQIRTVHEARQLQLLQHARNGNNPDS